MSEKKRKRLEESGERPKKKAAITSQGNVTVELVENKELLGPILGMYSAATWRRCGLMNGQR